MCVSRGAPSSVHSCPRAGVVCCGSPLFFPQSGLMMFRRFTMPEGIKVLFLPRIYAMSYACIYSLRFGSSAVGGPIYCVAVGCCFRALRPACCSVVSVVFLLLVFFGSLVGVWVLVGWAHVSRWGTRT